MRQVSKGSHEESTLPPRQQGNLGVTIRTDDDVLEPGAIAGITVGVCVGVFLIACLIMAPILVRRKLKVKEQFRMMQQNLENALEEDQGS